MEEKVFRCNKLRSTSGIITSQQAKKDLASGAEAYLVHLVLKVKKPKKIQGIIAMDAFPEVFEELLRLPLPPPREVDFLIELEPGIVPVHKEPYRMASLKLKELKGRLQELMTK